MYVIHCTTIYANYELLYIMFLTVRLREAPRILPVWIRALRRRLLGC